MLVADLPPVPAQETPIVWVQTVPRFGEDGARLDGVRNEATCGAMPVGYCALRGLAQAQSDLDLQPGEFSMFALDIPDQPDQTPSVVIVAQTNQAHRSGGKSERTMGVCYVVPNTPEMIKQYAAGNFPSQSLIYPYEDATSYFREFEHRTTRNPDKFNTSDVSTAIIIKPPKHGVLVDAGLGKYPAYYWAPGDYIGEDHAIIEATLNGYKVKIHYYFHSIDTSTYTDSAVCGKKGYIWKISTTPYTPLDVSTIQTLLSFTGTSRPIKVEIANLTGTAVGSPRRAQ